MTFDPVTLLTYLAIILAIGIIAAVAVCALDRSGE